MGLGIKKDSIYTIFSIPLEWETNEILANHFRYLADEVEKTNIEIISVSMVSPVNYDYSKTCLEIKGFVKEQEAINEKV